MKWFSYNVSGWVHTQVIKACSLEAAIEAAFPQAYGFTAVSQQEAEEIIFSWYSND